MRSRTVRLCAFILLLAALSFGQSNLRKIGELEVQVQGISATVQPANPTIPKNTAAGVRIVVSTPSGNLSSSDVARFVGGPFTVQGELSGPGLIGTITLPDPNSAAPVVDPLILPIPALNQAGDYTLSNLRLVVNGRPALDVTPSTVPLKVIDQVLITSVETRALTLDEIKAAGIVLDSNDFLGFQFTIGLATSSNVTTISFPVVFDRNGVPIPQPISPPAIPVRQEADIPAPAIVPVMMNLTDANGVPLAENAVKLPNGTPVPVKVPGVLVIPGDVGFLKQFFSAQLFVANGAPGGTGLIVHDVTGKINLPVAPDGIPADAPLSLPALKGAAQPDTKPVMGVGPDGQTGTGDDVNALNPGDQGEAEFILRGEQEGFHPISFDIAGTLDGLVTGPVKVTGTAQGAVLVRNPFFDMSFAVPAVVRSGEQFKMFVTVKNISQSTANLLKVTLDAAQMSGAVLLSDQTQTINTIPGGGSATLTYLFQSQRTGQVVASYLHFDTQDGTTGELRFTLGVGERGVPLSPDTLSLPSSVTKLPDSVVTAAMRVLGEAWSIANAPAGSLPAGVIRTNKSVVTKKALALAEAGLRVELGQPLEAALRDLMDDFYGGTPLDPGFDQLLRSTDAGHDFERAVGAALAPEIVNGGGVLNFHDELSHVLASGTDFISFAATSGGATPPVITRLVDGNGRGADEFIASAHPADDIPGFVQVPIGNVDASPIVGLLTTPAVYPYTLQLTGTGTGTLDLAVSMPNGDGNVIRGQLTGVPITAGMRARVVLDPANPNPLTLEQDTANNGTFTTQTAFFTSVISPAGPQFISASVIDGATLPGASALGVQVALLFDRVVDGVSAQQASNYQIPLNAVQQAKAQLSGRIVLANLQQPEGPYVPSTVSVSNIADTRGVVGPSGNKPLSSLLSDPGAVVSGRVFNSDGSAVAGAVVTYSAIPPSTCANEAHEDPVGVTATLVDADGHYQIRYVHQDQCGLAFTVSTQDPNTGALRALTNFVRNAGEQLIMDIPLFGRGGVTGTVRDLNGIAKPGATVVVVSQTDTQVGAQTITDGTGRYSVSGITVGPVSVRAGLGNALGRGFGNIARAGSNATVDVTLDSGSLSVSGTLEKIVDGGAPATVPNWPVVYSIVDPSTSSQPVAVAVANTDANGNFQFTGVPEGNFILSSQLTTRDGARITGFATANQNLTGQILAVTINNQSFGTASGTVTMPDGVTPAAGVVVQSGGRGVLSDANGGFTLQGLPVSSGSQGISAATTDGLRFGSASVLINTPGQVVTGIKIKLSGLGNATFTVLDSKGVPVRGQAVGLLSGNCPFTCGCNPQTTGADGTVTFTGLPLGRIDVKAISSALDVAQGSASIPADGATGFAVLRFAGAGSVSGNVLDPDGKPSFGTDIALSSNIFDQDSCSLLQGPSYHVQTDTAGNFSLTNVKVGRVAVTASQIFFPTPVGAQGNLLKDGDHLTFNLQLVNTIAGVFSGTVYLPDGVTPAGAGVEVTANGPLPDVTVKTDANSHYQFAKIFPQGTYTVTVRDPISGGVTQESIFLRAGQDVTHDFRLKGKGTVMVQVVDGFGLPVDSAVVKLTENTFPNEQLEDVIQPATQGKVTFPNVFEGGFSVEASDTFGRGGRTSSVLPGDGSSVDVVVQLTKTGTVSGHFLMPDGSTGIPFGSVSLIANGRQIGQLTTQSAGDPGAFSFTFVPNGPVLLQAQDPVTARTGIAAGTLDGATLTLDVIAEGLGTVQGTVTDNGVPEPGAIVDIFSGSYHASTSADSNGQYLVPGVPQGHIVVNAALQNNFLLGTTSGTLPGEGSVVTLNVALRGSGAIQGQVLQADGVTPAPPSLVTVSVGGQGGGTQSVTTDANGNFSFAIVPQGTASLNVTVLGAIDQGATSVDVTAGSTTNAAIRLNGVGSITGHTRDGAGAPIAGHLTITGTGAFPYTFVVDTNADGSFSFPQVLAGKFTATLRVPSGTVSLFGSTFASVLPGANTDVDVLLQPTGSVTGTVLRSDGVTPAAGANVTLTLSTGSIVVQAQTDGTFTANGVPLGPITLRVDDPVSTGEALVQGLTLTSEGQSLPVPTIILNDTPMKVLSIDPADGSTGVPVTQPIKITFTNALQSANGITIRTAQGGGVSLASSLSPDAKMVTFTGTLPDSAQITVTVTTGVTDTLGRSPIQATTATFQTVDLTPPHVASIVPANGTIQVATGSTITVNFSEPLSASTNLATLIAVSGPSGVIAGTTVLASPTQAVFTPSAGLPTNGNIGVVVNGATDLSGNVQTVAFNSSFATIDTIAPVVQLQSPANGAFSNSGRPGISFSATDALSGVNFATATISIDGQQVATGTLGFTPGVALADGTHTVSASVADRAGNIGSASGSFTVDTQPPSAAAIAGVVEGQILKGNVAISLSATDAGSGVSLIELLSDGIVIARVTTPFTLTLNTAATLADGNHTLTARATDVAGNVGPQGVPIHVVIDNVPLSVAFSSPKQGSPFNSQFTVIATANKSVQRIDFSFAGQVVSATASPYAATFSVATLTDGSQTVVATAFDFAGNSASSNLIIVVDKTPPSAPNTNLINAEPPLGGFSQVHGLVGAVEAFDTLQITNVTHPATASASVAGDGTFSANIAGAVDDTLSLVAIDGAGNQSTAVLVTVRQTSSLPPANGNTTLTYAGDLVDRVSATALTADGSLDSVFTLAINVGDGITRTLSRIDLSNGSTTHSTTGLSNGIGVSTDITSPFLNAGNGTISVVVTSGATLTLTTADNGFMVPGATFTATAFFTDGSKFVGTFLFVAPDDRPLIPHSATITASPAVLTPNSTSSGLSTITITNIRDINGSLVPDGAKIALSAANAATKNGFGDSILSAGGTIVDGAPSANNQNFKVFTISGGMVTATYSGQPVNPPGLTGTTAVIQMLAADSSGNVLGTEVAATQDINLRATTDKAIVSASPASLYADGGDHRSHVILQVRDSLGNPVPDGTLMAVSAANLASFIPGCCNIGSAGGTIIGGIPSASGSQYSVFSTIGGSFQFDYSDSGVSAGTDQTKQVVIAVMTANSNNTVNTSLVGSGNITLTGDSNVELASSMSSVPLVFPSIPVTIDIHHVHDARGNLIPDGSTLLVSAVNFATFIPGCCNISSAGGSIVDGLASPNNANFRYYTLASNQAAATYTVDGANTVGPGSTAVANVQLAMGDPQGRAIDGHLLKLLPLTLVPPSNAVGNAQPSSLLGDGAIHTSTVTFKPVLDAFGNQLPDGSKIAVSATNFATFIPGCCNISSAGGQILSGTPSPTGAQFLIHTVSGGAITVSYADQNVISTPGQIQTANIQLAEAKNDGTVPTAATISTVGIKIAGLTSATLVASPSVVFADGGDHRTTVTISNLKDASGNLVPDGTLVGVSAANFASFIPGCCSIGSAGGVIIGGVPTSPASSFQVFPVQNGQVVVQYSSQGVVVPSGQKTAVVQVVTVNSGGGVINAANVGSVSIQLLSPGSATVAAAPADVFSDGGTHTSAISITNLKDSDGVTPIPDGTRVGVSAVNFATFIPGCCSIGSVGGQILSAGASAGDGTIATANGNFNLFTVTGAQILATYADAGIVNGIGQTQTANIQLAPAASDGSIPTTAQFADGQVLLRGFGSATGSGPTTLSKSGGSALITFSGIKDTAGHLVPDGTLVAVSASNFATFIPGCCSIGSAGGTIVDGSTSPSNAAFKVFVVQNGSITVTYSPSTSGLGTANIQITGAKPDGSLISTVALSGGVWGINITN